MTVSTVAPALAGRSAAAATASATAVPASFRSWIAAAPLPGGEAAEPGARSPGRTVTCFSVVAAADPGVLPRVIAVFAKRGYVPCQCYATVAGPGDGDLHVDVQVSDLAQPVADVIAETLRQIVAVDTVLTAERAVARPA